VEVYNENLEETRVFIGDETVTRFPGTFRTCPYLPYPLPDLTPPSSPSDAEDVIQDLNRHRAVSYETKLQAQLPRNIRLRHQDPALINEYPIADLSECSTCGCYTFGRCPGCQSCARQGGLNGEFFVAIYGVPFRPLCSTCQSSFVGASCRYCRFELEAQRISTLQNCVDRVELYVDCGKDYFNPAHTPNGRVICLFGTDIGIIPAAGPRRLPLTSARASTPLTRHGSRRRHSARPPNRG
jgi:hypothetical protein